MNSHYIKQLSLEDLESGLVPYLEKYDDGKYKKWYRNQAARRLRRKRDWEPLQRGAYKKDYDVWWSLY